MGIRIVHICNRCQKEVEEGWPGYSEWRIISQAWLSHDRIPSQEVTLCPGCLKEMGLYALFYGEEEEARCTT